MHHFACLAYATEPIRGTKIVTFARRAASRSVSGRDNPKLQHVKNYFNSNLNNYMRKRSNLIFDEIHYTKWSGRWRRWTCDLNICAVSLCISIHKCTKPPIPLLGKVYIYMCICIYVYACMHIELT